MDLTTSLDPCFPADVRARYLFAETRNATTILASTNPDAFDQLVNVLRQFHLRTSALLSPNGQESDSAARANRMFREQRLA